MKISSRTDFNLFAISIAHFSSLRTTDTILSVAISVAIAVLSIFRDFTLNDGDLDSASTAVSILAGLLFGLLIMILEFASSAATQAELAGKPSPGSIRRAKLARSLGANVAFTSLLALLVAGALVVIGITTSANDACVPHSALAASALTFLGCNLLLIISRCFKLLHGETSTALTGAPPGN